MYPTNQFLSKLIANFTIKYLLAPVQLLACTVLTMSLGPAAVKWSVVKSWYDHTAM